MQTLLDSSLDDLANMGFVHRDEAGACEATQLGKAIVASSLEPEDGAFVHRELQRALRAFVLDGEMHILYTFTPVQDFAINVNWRVFRNEVEDLDESAHRVMSFLVSSTRRLCCPANACLRNTTDLEYCRGFGRRSLVKCEPTEGQHASARY